MRIITSKQVEGRDRRYALKNVSDFTSDSSYLSKNELGQCVCWDFHEMCFRPTHCTIRALGLKSGISEGSLDGSNWRELDQQTDSQDFVGWGSVSSTVLKPAEFRFMWLIPTGKTHHGHNDLVLGAVEFFGTPSE
jgi:hypothetical protein